jgi:CBS domain-containing protein
MRFITCRLCGHQNPTGGDACENCGAEFSEGKPEPAGGFEGRLLGTPLGALTVTPPLWLAAATDALAAVEQMKAGGFDCVLVGEPGQLAGIFTDRDAILKLSGLPLARVALDTVMTRNPVVLRPEDTVAMGIHKMAVGGFRHLPLAAAEGVVGVVAARDIFRHLAARLEDRPGDRLAAGPRDPSRSPAASIDPGSTQ